MKITVFNGSPRAERSSSHIMVEAFAKGANEAGAELENIFLVNKNIHYCLGCFNCWIKTPGECSIKDDMGELLEKYLNSDMVVFASPVYVGSVSGIMKNFLDRLLPLADPHLIMGKQGVMSHPYRQQKYPKIILISNCGFPEQAHFKYFRSIFAYMADNSGMEIVAEIYRGEGELLKRNELILRPFIDHYKKMLQRAGKEIAQTGKLSEKTHTELEKPLIPYEMYAKQANKYFDDRIEAINHRTI